MNRSSLQLIIIFIIIEVTSGIIFTAPATPTTQQVPIVTRTSKAMLPANLVAEAKEKNMSILTPTAAQLPVLYQNYPNGNVLFPNNPDVASAFNTMIDSIKKNPSLIEFFRKIHILALNQLYMYLMKIYTNLNLTNSGYSFDSATPTTSIPDFLKDEALYDINKKRLAINHFMNLIQSQFGLSIISYVPTTVPDTAVTLGKIFVSNDYGIDLTPFTQSQKDPAIIASQEVFINFLRQYINFFKTYTDLLSKIDAKGISQFYYVAQSISTMLYPQNANQPTLKMNPSMFFYDIESMRAIQFIPFVAGTIHAKSKTIPWAPAAVNAAVKNLIVNKHAVAFFKDAAGKYTQDQTKAAHLYFMIETGPSLFEQELLAQPAWLNTQEGCIRILRACLGDFSALVGTGILEDESEKIIQKALSGMNKTQEPNNVIKQSTPAVATKAEKK